MMGFGSIHAPTCQPLEPALQRRAVVVVAVVVVAVVVLTLVTVVKVVVTAVVVGASVVSLSHSVFAAAFGHESGMQPNVDHSLLMLIAIFPSNLQFASALASANLSIFHFSWSLIVTDMPLVLSPINLTFSIPFKEVIPGILSITMPDGMVSTFCNAAMFVIFGHSHKSTLASLLPGRLSVIRLIVIFAQVSCVQSRQL